MWHKIAGLWPKIGQSTSWYVRCTEDRSLGMTFGMDIINGKPATLLQWEIPCTEHVLHDAKAETTVLSSASQLHPASTRLIQSLCSCKGIWVYEQPLSPCGGTNPGVALPRNCLLAQRPEWHSWYLLTAPRSFLEDEALLVGVIGAELWAVSFLSCSTSFGEEEDVLITPWALSQSFFP